MIIRILLSSITNQSCLNSLTPYEFRSGSSVPNLGTVSIWNEKFNVSVPEERTVPDRRRRCYRTIPDRRQQTSNRGHSRKSAIADEPPFDSWSLLNPRGRKIFDFFSLPKSAPAVTPSPGKAQGRIAQVAA
ncbi:PREDICTED: PRUPE_5G037800 [Prunus dulcis]|uniref:PREDICTED: PRUPE_5G037800 n=1 Tax=Prunus dulcis TaxID=3755 RepID=A0A5E4FE26_PRUDU|nr:PREDICTED: PRUPE_5G037800 [Prunus dulcis]